MFWVTLTVLAVYLLLQTVLGIVSLVFSNRHGSSRTDAGTRAGNDVIPTH